MFDQHDVAAIQSDGPMPAPHARIALDVWLADLTYTQQTIAADVIPNAIGGIATFAESVMDLARPMRLFKYPEKLVEALNAGEKPDVIGFSNYVWNADLAYQFAKLIKKHLPGTIVVFGGPNYPVDEIEQERFLRERPAIDFYVIKEGEVAFTRLVEALAAAKGDIEDVKQAALASVHSVTADGRLIRAEAVERITDLTQIPSPYVSGRLDEFFDGRLLPIVQTNRGCPFSCTFCVEGVRYYSKVYRNSGEKISAELDYIGRKMAELRAKGGRNDLFIADSNFGMYKEDIDTAHQLARTRNLYQWPEYINVATGKNQKERVLEASRIIDGALRLSGSVQSLDPEVLEKIKRNNISADGLMELALRASEVGANTYSEIILGLPGDTKEKHFKTVRTVMDAGFTNLYLFQLMFLHGSDLGTARTKDESGSVSRFRVLPRCYGHFEVFGERLIAAEIEEICVANSGLSFEDYLACRKLHLVTTIFYNDGVFGTLVKLLRLLDTSVFAWMEALQSTDLPPGLAAVFESFHEATQGELWDEAAPLAEFIREPGNVEKYIAGELGNNLLFVHKTMAVTRHVDALAEIAGKTIRRVLAGYGKDSPAILTFVADCLAYHRARLTNIFSDRDTAPSVTLTYDIEQFEAAHKPAGIEPYELDSPTEYSFHLDDAQVELIERYLGIYGDSTVGIGRIISKVYVKRLFRKPQARNSGRAAVA